MFIENILRFLHFEMETPTAFGWYHIVCWLVLIAAIVAIVVFRKKISDKAVTITLLSIWVVMIFGEIYRELVHSFDMDTGVLEYNWAYFPFQFCSSPLFVLPCAVFIKHKATKQFFYDFLATYSLFAGLIVMIIPGDVFTEVGLINVQTMVHHGGMVAIAVLMYATSKVKFSLFTVLRATAVFMGFLFVAMILNATIDKPGFNMFYIDWVEGCHLPIIGAFYPTDAAARTMPYFVFFMIYTLGFMICASVIHAVAFGADALRKVLVKEKKTEICAEDCACESVQVEEAAACDVDKAE